MKKSFEVKVLNQKFVLKTDSDERYVQKVADLVNEKVFNIQEKTKSVSSLNVAILAALNIADDYYKIKSKRSNKVASVEKRLRELMQILESEVA